VVDLKSIDRAGWCFSNSVRLILGRHLVRMSVGTPAILTDDFREFPQSFQENTRVVYQLVHSKSLFINHTIIRHYTLLAMDSEIK
jgi:aromatic ring hydroxylase